MKNKINLAILVNSRMLEITFANEDISYLKTFANIINIDEYVNEITPEYMAKHLPNADAVFTCWGTPKFDESILSNAPNLKIILHSAGTPKAIVTDSVWERNIRVATAAPIIAKDVAESALGGIIYWLKQFKNFDNIVRNKQWVSNYKSIDDNPVNALKKHMKRLNSRLNVGIIGASHVGKNMIKILKPFGVNILLYDPYVSDSMAKDLSVTLSSLDEIARSCDVVTVHAPSLPSTNNMINKSFFDKLMDGCIFVNTARGSIVNEKDLINELEKNRIYAYLDVFESEPLSIDSELLKFENVLLTPHISGGHTLNGGKERGRYVIDQLNRYLATRTLVDEVIKDMLEFMA